MIGSIFTIIELILKLFSLWDGFIDYASAKRKADMEAKQQARDRAVDKSTTAETEDEIWNSQDEITKNLP